MEIRPCLPDDVERIEQHLPSGLTRAHARRFQRQEQGLSTVLVAWLDGVPAGLGEVRWDGCADPQLRHRYPDCPELNGLHVLAHCRSRGIGTALITAAEQAAQQHRWCQLGLGVDDRNHRAAALYRRLGYAETGCRYLDRYHYISDDGQRHDVVDTCRFMVKSLFG